MVSTMSVRCISRDFILLGDSICMISVYDGDFSNYIRDFIATIGSVFDAVMSEVEGGEALIPTQDNIEEFIDWVHAHDLFQAPDFPTDLFALQDAEKGAPPNAPRARTPVLAARTDPAIARQSQSLSGRGLSCLSRLFCRAGAPKIWIGLVSTTFNPDDIQGNILRGYQLQAGALSHP